ncbi:MAG: iron-containing alcohol dehydrogenase [Pseudomonadota bacterium]
MRPFNYYQPTSIHFGTGKLNDVATVVGQYGKRCFLVTGKSNALAAAFTKITKLLTDAGIAVHHYAGATPNPTLDDVTLGTEQAIAFKADVILGVGGGSTIDVAKAIAVQATHEGNAFDYLYYSPKQPTTKTLPIVAISTTSGTGTHTSKVAVITRNEDKHKSAIASPYIFAKAAIVDPELMVTLPENVTASTGWDAFTHTFESYLNTNHNPYVDLLCLEAIKLVKTNLPIVLTDSNNLEARAAMALADTYAGMCIANVGTIMPHAMGQAISGHFPHVSHGQSLAVIYPEFTRFTYESAIDRFATVGRIFNPALQSENDDTAARQCCEEIDAFLKQINMWFTLDSLQVDQAEMPGIIKHCMAFPDSQASPKVPTEQDIIALYNKARTH